VHEFQAAVNRASRQLEALIALTIQREANATNERVDSCLFRQTYLSVSAFNSSSLTQRSVVQRSGKVVFVEQTKPNRVSQ
jgi:hypothetical protein